MPLFDFFCQHCRQHFSELVKGSEEIICPHCESKLTKKLFSVFNKISDDTKLETNAGDLPSMQDLQRFKRTGRLKR